MSDKPDLRPLSARALKSAIDTLRPHLFDARVLDLFAGQGRFGQEALREQAAHVTFVEKNKKTCQDLEKSIKRFSGRYDIRPSEVTSFLSEPTSTFDIVFADPPFRLWTESFFEKLFLSVQKALVPDGIFLVKHPKRMVLSPPIAWGFVVLKTSQFGESGLSYFRYEKNAPAA